MYYRSRRKDYFPLWMKRFRDMKPLREETITRLVLSYAVLTRVVPYLVNRSLRENECSLAVNILDRTFGQLAGHLSNAQAAPLLFMWISKMLVSLFGDSELVFRFFPFLSGVVSIFLFHALAKRLLDARGVMLAVVLFAVSHRLVLYSIQFKQYQSDVMLAVLLTWEAVCMLQEGTSRKRWVLLSLSGALSVWLSHSAIFVLASCGSVLALDAWMHRKKNEVLPLACAGTLWFGCFAGMYLIQITKTLANDTILNYWGGRIAPFPIQSFKDLMWYVERPFVLVLEPGGYGRKSLAVFLFFAGGLILVREKGYRFALLVLLPFAFALFGSIGGSYPIYGRTMLFSLPFMILCIAAALRFLFHKQTLVGFLAFVMLAGSPIARSAHRVFRPQQFDDVRYVVREMEKEHHPDDLVYVYSGASNQWGIYGRGKGYRVVCGIGSRRDPAKYLDDVDQAFAQGRRTWLVFSHVCNWMGVEEREYILRHVNEKANLLKKIEAFGAYAYVYAPVTSPASKSTDEKEPSREIEQKTEM